MTAVTNKGVLYHLIEELYRRIMLALPPTISLTTQYLRHHRRWPRLSHPCTFNEKLLWRKLHDRDPRFVLFADKVRVKAVVREVLGEDWCIPTLWSGTELPDAPQWELPFVIKANHASGWNLFVSNPNADWNEVRTVCHSWLGKIMAPYLGEWFYREIKPCLLVEPMIGGNLIDYKFFVFGGRVEYVQVDTDRFRGHKRAFFDRDWSRQSFACKYPLETKDLPRPERFAEMLAAAERLAAGFDFCRIDLYNVNGQLKFGEVTFVPEAGHGRFTPMSIDLYFGTLWRSGF